jgi:hypothetical protein
MASTECCDIFSRGRFWLRWWRLVVLWQSGTLEVMEITGAFEWRGREMSEAGPNGRL